MTCFKIKYFVVSFCEDYNNYHNCNNIVIITRYCSNFQPPEGTGHPGLEKYLNSPFPVGQVTLNFCLSLALTCLPKFSNSLIIHKPKDGSHA